MKKLKAILIGAGNRGTAYTEEMFGMSDKFEVVAVAEPIDSRREFIKNRHNIPEDRCFTDYKPLFELGRIADIAIVATMDRQHFEPAMMAIALKYHVLLEKPIAPTAEECEAITRAADENGVHVVICTVMRYTPLFRGVKDILNSGRIGRIMSVAHQECVGNIHQTHSFVRGNWGNEAKSSPMLLQKSCHDLDMLFWILGKRCKSVQSFGKLSFFTEENAPEGSTDYCVQGCPHLDTCPYNAIKVYYDDKDNDWFRTTCTRIASPTDEDVMKAITETQYGKCVYKCDNDVVDHQVVNMLFEDDITVTFTMAAFTDAGRITHIMGTKGEIFVQMDGEGFIKIHTFADQKTEVIPASSVGDIAHGHGGGDHGILVALYDYVMGTYEGDAIPEIAESNYSHQLVFAAEAARLTGSIVDVDEFIAGINV